MENKVCITDFIYALHLNPSNVSIALLQEMYQTDSQKFLTYLKQHFDINYQNVVLDRIGIGNLNPGYTQEQINKCFKEWENFFYIHGDTTFLKERGITQEQVDRFKLGSTHCFGNNKITTDFLKDLKIKYPIELLEDILYFHSNNKQTNLDLYDAPNFVTIPGNNGIVYRSIGWYKLDTLRNLYKFFVSHAPTFIFNESALQYDKIIIVEGVFDVLALDTLGIKNSICFSSTRASIYQYELIKNKKCIFIFDGDLGGQVGIDYVKETYNNPLFEYKLLDSTKDFDELIKEEVLSVIPEEFLYLKQNNT